MPDRSTSLRRRSFLSLGAAATVAGAGAAAHGAAAPAPWGEATNLGMNAAHTGVTLGRPLSRNLRLRWAKDFTTGMQQPLIVGNRMFLLLGTRKVEAYSVATGARLWKWWRTPSQDFGISGIAYDGGRVVTVEADGTVRALDAATGRQVWSRTLVRQRVFREPPVARAGSVYVVAAGLGSTLWSFRASDGKLQWFRDLPALVHHPAVDATGVYLDDGRRTAYRVGLDGRLVWERDHPHTYWSGAGSTLAQGELWLAGQGVQHPASVLSAGTGDRLRLFRSSTRPIRTGTSAISLIYAYPSNATGRNELRHTDARTGATRWSVTGPRLDSPLVGPAVVSGRTLFMGSIEGEVYGHDIDTGRLVWTGDVGAQMPGDGSDPFAVPAQGVMRMGPAIGGGVLAVPAGTRLAVFG